MYTHSNTNYVDQLRETNLLSFVDPSVFRIQWICICILAVGHLFSSERRANHCYVRLRFMY